ncbi:family A1 protease [Peniophora sp. CONT]|nr:family A1 protease [Peniophora sp. CONT]
MYFTIVKAVALLVLALNAVASPVATVDEPLVRIPLTRRFDGVNLLAKDRARVKHVLSRALSHTDSEARDALAHSASLTNNIVHYVATIQVGIPPKPFEVIVDTGSSFTWIGANTSHTYTPTQTSHRDSGPFHVSYGSAKFNGTGYTDTVALGNMTVLNQFIGVADNSSGIWNADGILGIGPTNLTQGIVPGKAFVPTFTDNLYDQSPLPRTSDSVAISFGPTTELITTNGELTFGEVDSSKYTGLITYSTVASDAIRNNVWGINQSIKYGSSLILNSSAGFVDTGTTINHLATDIYHEYAMKTGGIRDEATGMLIITEEQYEELESMYFIINGTTFELTPDAQLWPRTLNTNVGGGADKLYLAMGDMGTNSTRGFSFTIGYTFLERFYTVFDSTNNRIGFAATAYTNAATNHKLKT